MTRSDLLCCTEGTPPCDPEIRMRPLTWVRREQEIAMRTFGYISAASLAATSAALGLVVVMSWPDVQRYLRIRKM